MILEVARVLRVLPQVERLRASVGPTRAAQLLRSSSTRRPSDSARLARAVAFVDARSSGGPNCYRRALLRIALDANAESLKLGFKLDGEAVTGHAWLGDEDQGQWDVVIDA